MIHFYYGDNDFEIKQQISLVKSQFVKKYGIENFVKLDSFDTDKVITEVTSVGLFSNNRLVILEDVFVNNDLVKKLPDILPLIQKETELIIVSTKPDKRTKLYKNLSTANSREFRMPNNIRQFVVSESKKQQVEIDGEAIDELIMCTTGDIWRITNEISKLKMFSKRITKSDIEKIVEPNLEIDVFRILDDIFSKQTEQAIRKLETIKHNSDPNRFLALMSSQVFALSIAKNSNKPSSVTAKETKIHPFLMSKMYDVAQRITKDEAAKIAKIIAKTDGKLKLSSKEDGWNLVSLAIKRI